MNRATYPIMYWFGPSAMDEKSANMIAEAGFTRIPIEGRNKEENIKIIELCAAAGIEAMVADRRISEAIRDFKNCEPILAQVVGDYAGFKNVKAYYITDEPSCNDFEALGNVCATLTRLDPGREAYINLFPNYASAEQLGAESYKKHIDLYVDIVKPSIISYDHYHFVGRNLENKADAAKSERERLICEAAWNTEQRAGFFDNIETIRKKSLETGIDFMVIVLLVEHGPYRNLSEAEIRWEVFQSLAYGSSRISYFTYGTPAYEENWRYTNGMVDTNGEPTRHYYDVMRINKDLKIVGAQLAGKKSEAVYHIGEETDTSIKYYDPKENMVGIGDIKVTGALTLGFFEGGEIMLANKDYISLNKVDITVNPDQNVFVFDKAAGQWYRLIKSAGACTLSLMPGDGELIKIL
ncbi:MAG: hypothetical protein FWH48_11175 [Oscillospiraceae bacterium]|nr:hypothetical protein [Oscillospiraceae bacterium]